MVVDFIVVVVCLEDFLVVFFRKFCLVWFMILFLRGVDFLGIGCMFVDVCCVFEGAMVRDIVVLFVFFLCGFIFYSVGVYCGLFVCLVRVGFEDFIYVFFLVLCRIFF